MLTFEEYDEDTPNRTFNDDERGCSTFPNKQKLFLRNHPETLIFSLQHRVRQCIVLACGSAAGVYFPPLK